MIPENDENDRIHLRSYFNIINNILLKNKTNELFR